MRQTIQVNGPWHFQMDVADVGLKEMWYSPKYQRETWSAVVVPGAWDCYEEALRNFEGIGWYSATFTSPVLDKAGECRLVFGRVMYHSTVWVNGRKMGENVNGYLPFGFDVTSLLKAGQENEVVVRVDNQPRVEWLPGAPVIEWVQYGGILQPVRLEVRPAVFILDYAFNAVPEGQGGRLNAVFEIKNNSRTSFKGMLHVKVVAGRKTATQCVPVTCPTRSSVSLSIGMHLATAAHWSPDTPVLHGCEASLVTAGDQVLDTIRDRFGIRSIATHGTQILLNGKPIAIKGVNRYDEYGDYGPNPPADKLDKELRLLKACGVNCIRVHYPQSPELLRLYDEHGFMMMEEVPLNWWGMNWWPDKKKVPQRMDILPPAMAALEGMIRRDRNHPCVIAWSMANECATHTRMGATVMRRLMRRARELDPSRLVTFVVANDVRPHKAAAQADLICTNVYYGLHNGEVARRMSQIRKLVYEPTKRHLQEHAAAFPGKPVVVAEFGMRSIYGLSGTTDYTEEFHAAYLDAVLRAMSEVKEVAGGMLWSWADYRHRRDMIQYAPFGPYGVVTLDRKPKRALQVMAKWYLKTKPVKR